MIFVCSRIFYITFKPDCKLRGGARSEKNIYFKKCYNQKKFVSNRTNLASQFQSEKIACVFSNLT